MEHARGQIFRFVRVAGPVIYVIVNPSHIPLIQQRESILAALRSAHNHLVLRQRSNLRRLGWFYTFNTVSNRKFRQRLIASVVDNTKHR